MGEGGIDLPGPWIVGDRVSGCAVVPLPYMVLIWCGYLSSTNTRPGQYQHYVKDLFCHEGGLVQNMNNDNNYS